MRKMNYIASLMATLLISLGTTFLPKNILFSIVRAYANMKFYLLKRGNQKYILFDAAFDDTKNDDTKNKFRLTEDRIATFGRRAELSLRSVVMENRKQMKPAETDMEQGLQLLAEGQ